MFILVIWKAFAVSDKMTPIVQAVASTSTSTSTLFHKTIGYNRLARKIAIANLGGPVKRKINCCSSFVLVGLEKMTENFTPFAKKK